MESIKKKKKELIQDFTSGNVTKQLVTFAAPLALSNLLQILYNLADMIIVGQKLGDIGLSAVSVGGDIAHFLTFIVMGFAGANQVIISQYIGAGQRDKIGRFIGTMLITLFGSAIVISIGCFFYRNELLALMNTPALAWDEAYDYITVSIIGLIFIYGYNICSSIMRGMGDSKHPFIFISIAAVLNVLLDLLFVTVFDWRAGGAALATVISQGLSFIIAAAFLIRNKDNLGFTMTTADFRIDVPMLKKLLALGTPMAIKSASVQFSKLFVNSYINSYGLAVSAVAGIGNKLASICNLISMALNNAGSAMVGQNIGAEKYRRVTSIMISSFNISLGISAIMSLALWLFPEQIFSIFDGSEEVVKIAVEVLLPITILNFFASALRSPMNALVNGTGNYYANFAVAILDGIVMRIGLALLFGIEMNMGYEGFWLGDALANCTPFAIGIVYYATGKWKTRKYIIGK